MTKWQLGSKPEEVTTEDGKFIGFADGGWASTIIKAHNLEVELSLKEKRCDCSQKEKHKKLAI